MPHLIVKLAAASMNPPSGNWPLDKTNKDHHEKHETSLAHSPARRDGRYQPPVGARAGRPGHYAGLLCRRVQATVPNGIKPYIAQVESTFKPFSGRYVV
jgi:hypothetical protein